MKKKLVTVLLASSMVATMLAGCGSGSGDGTEKGSSAKGGDGSVYMLNFKPETDQAWQDLAEKYTDETGVKVTVVTAADGQYKTTQHLSLSLLRRMLQQSSISEAQQTAQSMTNTYMT